MNFGLVSAYFALYAVLIGMAIWSPKSRRLNAWLLLVLWPILVLPSWRLEGTDRFVYQMAFDGTVPVSEWSFNFLCRLVSGMGGDLRLVLLGYAMVAVGLVLLSIWLFNRRVWWCVLIYYSFSYVLHAMIQIRASVAIALFLFAVVLFERRFSRGGAVPAFIGSALAHNSALIGIIPWPLARLVRGAALPIVALVVSVAFYLCGFSLTGILKLLPFDFVQIRLERHLFAMSVGEGLQYNALGILRMLQIAAAVFLLVNHRSVDRYLRSPAWLNLFVVGLSFGPIFADFPALAARGTEFLVAIEMFLFPCAAFVYFRRWGIVPVIGYALLNTYCCVIRSGIWT